MLNVLCKQEAEREEEYEQRFEHWITLTAQSLPGHIFIGARVSAIRKRAQKFGGQFPECMVRRTTARVLTRPPLLAEITDTPPWRSGVYSALIPGMRSRGSNDPGRGWL